MYVVLEVLALVLDHCCRGHACLRVGIAVLFCSPSALKQAKSNCTTGMLLVALFRGRASARPLLATQFGHTALSCCVGCCGALMPFAGLANCGCSSSGCSSTYPLSKTLFSSKLVEPFYGVVNSAVVFVQSSSILYPLVQLLVSQMLFWML